MRTCQSAHYWKRATYPKVPHLPFKEATPPSPVFWSIQVLSSAISFSHPGNRCAMVWMWAEVFSPSYIVCEEYVVNLILSDTLLEWTGECFGCGLNGADLRSLSLSVVTVWLSYVPANVFKYFRFALKVQMEKTFWLCHSLHSGVLTLSHTHTHTCRCTLSHNTTINQSRNWLNKYFISYHIYTIAQTSLI